MGKSERAAARKSATCGRGGGEVAVVMAQMKWNRSKSKCIVALLVGRLEGVNLSGKEHKELVEEVAATDNDGTKHSCLLVHGQAS